MRSRKLFLAIAAAVASTLCVVVSLASQDEPEFKITLNTSDVSVRVNVVDTAGRPMIKLTREDFSIYEDGEQQQIRTFESVDVPFNILVLVDCSGSTQADWGLMGNAIDRFASMLRDQDRISVAQFGNEVEPLMNWQSRGAGPLGVSIRSNSPTCAGTDFYGALETAIGKFKGINGRKGVVVLTDGVQVPFAQQNMVIAGRRIQRVSDSVSDRDFQKALRAVSRSEVVFYFVAVNTDLNPDRVGRGYYGPPVPQVRPGQRGGPVGATGGAYDPARIYNMQQARTRMEQVSDVTGGRVAFPKKPSDVVPLYEDIGREFGTEYGLSYAPMKLLDANDTKPRKIEVRVKGVGLTVKQNRSSYTPSAR